MSFTTLFKALKEKFYIFIITALIFGAFSYYASNNLLSKIYESEVRVYINKVTENDASNAFEKEYELEGNAQKGIRKVPLYEYLRDATYVNEQLAKDYRDIIKSEMFLKEVKQILNDPKLDENSLKNIINASVKNETRIVTIKAQTNNSQNSAKIANATADALKSFNKKLFPQDNIEIIDTAKENKIPIFPNVKRAVFLSLILSLFASVFIIITLNYLNKVIKNELDIMLANNDFNTKIFDISENKLSFGVSEMLCFLKKTGKKIIAVEENNISSIPLNVASTIASLGFKTLFVSYNKNINSNTSFETLFVSNDDENKASNAIYKIESLKNEYDFIVIDTNYKANSSFMFYALSEQIFIAVQYENTKKDDIISLNKKLEKSDIKINGALVF